VFVVLFVCSIVRCFVLSELLTFVLFLIVGDLLLLCSPDEVSQIERPVFVCPKAPAHLSSCYGRLTAVHLNSIVTFCTHFLFDFDILTLNPALFFDM
jgi:hypothetical protein